MQVWTLTLEAVVGGKQRGPSATMASQCPLDQLLSRPGSASGVGAQTPGHQLGRARGPTTSRLWKASRARTGGRAAFQLHPQPGVLKWPLSQGPFWLTVLQISVILPDLCDSISIPHTSMSLKLL